MRKCIIRLRIQPKLIQRYCARDCQVGKAERRVIVSRKKLINFKDPLWILEWLETALEKEIEKYEKCPVIPDNVGGVEVAQGWGYVVAGYFLVEESFKALSFVRDKEVPRKHSLSTLFELLDEQDVTVLREYYADYRATIEGHRAAFPFESLDEFLSNLDGGTNSHGNHVGSFDWRYFLIEQEQSPTMPLVSVDYLLESVYGCIRTIEFALHGRFEPSRYTRSWRMRRDRRSLFDDWLTARMASNGWDDLGDRLEIAWGPDYLERYDLYFFRRKGLNDSFSKIPSEVDLPIVDRREDFAAFLADKPRRI